VTARPARFFSLCSGRHVGPDGQPLAPRASHSAADRVGPRCQPYPLPLSLSPGPGLSSRSPFNEIRLWRGDNCPSAPAAGDLGQWCRQDSWPGLRGGTIKAQDRDPLLHPPGTTRHVPLCRRRLGFPSGLAFRSARVGGDDRRRPVKSTVPSI
jgi:hypothetical protein